MMRAVIPPSSVTPLASFGLSRPETTTTTTTTTTPLPPPHHRHYHHYYTATTTTAAPPPPPHHHHPPSGATPEGVTFQSFFDASVLLPVQSAEGMLLMGTAGAFPVSAPPPGTTPTMIVAAGFINGAVSRTVTAPTDRLRAVLATGAYPDVRTAFRWALPRSLLAPCTISSRSPHLFCSLPRVARVRAHSRLQSSLFLSTLPFCVACAIHTHFSLSSPHLLSTARFCASRA